MPSLTIKVRDIHKSEQKAMAVLRLILACLVLTMGSYSGRVYIRPLRNMQNEERNAPQITNTDMVDRMGFLKSFYA